MYRRESLPKPGGQKKKRDQPNRKRDILVNFRMSSEEKEVLENRIKMSGLEKQEFIVKSILNQQIVVFGNKRLFDDLRNQLISLNEDLKQLETKNNLDIVKLEMLRTICELIAAF